jgi:ribulose-5-phosphate 4-epimerase/fuculose-1-phosphate aldolase
LVEAGARLVAAGVSPGSSGNVSVRVDEAMLMSPTGAALAALDPDQLSWVHLTDGRLAGPPPSKEVPFHQAFYARDGAFGAVVHVHAPAAVAASCLEPWSAVSAVPPLTPYFVMRVGQVPLIPYADPGDRSQADLIEGLAQPFRAVLLQNHGLVAAGPTLSEAVAVTLELEQTCDLWLRLGDQSFRCLRADAVRRLADRYGSPWSQV